MTSVLPQLTRGRAAVRGCPDVRPTTSELADPSVYEAIRVARPLAPIRGWRTPTSRWQHFERMPHWPSGLIVRAMPTHELTDDHELTADHELPSGQDAPSTASVPSS